MVKRIDYPFEVRPLAAEEGEGFLISYPDFLIAFQTGKPRAKAEGVSLNTLVLAFIADGLGRKEGHA